MHQGTLHQGNIAAHIHQERRFIRFPVVASPGGGIRSQVGGDPVDYLKILCSTAHTAWETFGQGKRRRRILIIRPRSPGGLVRKRRNLNIVAVKNHVIIRLLLLRLPAGKTVCVPDALHSMP